MANAGKYEPEPEKLRIWTRFTQCVLLFRKNLSTDQYVLGLEDGSNNFLINDSNTSVLRLHWKLLVDSQGITNFQGADYCYYYF